MSRERVGLLAAKVCRPASEPTGPPVLLIHSFPSSGERDFGPWVGELNDLGRTACLVDLPGHGEGGTAERIDDVTTSRVAAGLAAVAASLGDEVDVIGYSLGARLAWELPALARVRRLVLGGIGPSDPFALVYRDELEAFAATGREPQHEYTSRIVASITGGGLNEPGLARLIAGLASEPFEPDRARAPQVPTVFVVGREDTMMQTGLETIVGLVPGATLTVAPGDHRGALESREFRTLALSFLAS